MKHLVHNYSQSALRRAASLVASCAGVIALTSPKTVFAAEILNSNLEDRIVNATDLGTTSPRDVTVNIINLALTFVSLIVVVLILYGGFLWMTSGGNEEKVGQAKKILFSAVLGLLVVASAWGITLFLINTGNDVTR